HRQLHERGLATDAAAGTAVGLQVAREMTEHRLSDAQVREPLAHIVARQQTAGPRLGDDRRETAAAASRPTRAQPAERLTLEGQHRARHPPPTVDFAEDVRPTDAH